MARTFKRIGYNNICQSVSWVILGQPCLYSDTPEYRVKTRHSSQRYPYYTSAWDDRTCSTYLADHSWYHSQEYWYFYNYKHKRAKKYVNKKNPHHQG